MRFGRFTSLQLSLALRVTAFYAVAAAIVLGILVFRAYDVNATLDRRNLSIRAANLALYVSVDPSGAARLDLPPTLQAVYAAQTSADIFAIRGPDRRVITAVPPAFGKLVVEWPNATNSPGYFHLEGFGDESADYYGLS